MELYVMFVFVAFLQLSPAFLMPDILANGTTPSVVSSSSESIEQRPHDLTTWLLEEKHIRYTLEQRLTLTENKVNIFDKFHEAVTKELQAERDKINRLERNLVNANTTNDSLVNDLYNANVKIDALEKKLNNATTKIAALEKDNQSDRDKVSRLEQNLANATSEIDSLVKDSKAGRIMIQSLEHNLNNATAKIYALEKDKYFERGNISRLEQNLANATSEIGALENIISKLEYRFNDSTVEIDNLHTGIQQLNETQLHSESNRTLWNKDNMVAFSVDGPDTKFHNPQLFRNQPLKLGGGYNNSTGKFVCPTPGIYVFMWDIIKYSNGSTLYCCLDINGSYYSNACAFTGGGSAERQSGSRSTITHLKINDQVSLYCTSGMYFGYSGFSGFLLYPDS